MIMKFETLLLRGLFGACVLVCGLTLLAMASAKPASNVVTSGHSIAETSSAATVHGRMTG